MIMKRLFIALSILCFWVQVDAQGNQPLPYKEELERAHQAFDAKKYNTSATLFRKLYAKIKDPEQKQKVLFMIAESYRMSNNYSQAIRWFEEVVNSKYPDPNVIYRYGQLLKNFERYDEAVRQFYDYSFEIPDDPRGKQAQQNSQLAMEWKANPEKFIISNLTELNTEVSDYAPTFQNGKIYWTSSRKEAQGTGIFEWTGQKFEDLFEASQQPGGSFANINPLKEVNTNFNDGSAWVDSSGSSLYFTQCNGADGKQVYCKIYVSYNQNGHWTVPKALPFNSDSFSCGQPAWSTDGKRLFFASDMQGGYGEKDLYYIHYDAIKDSWGSPVNLGPNVNTAEDDMFPFMDEEGTLYFSSAGRQNMGGLDIFKTSDSAGTFKKAVNLRYPINSGGDDFGIRFLPKAQNRENAPIAYFSSNRQNGVGDNDIYSITIKPFAFLVKGKTIDKDTRQVLGQAKVVLTDKTGGVLFSVLSNDKGEFVGEIPLNVLSNLIASKKDYFSSSAVEISSIGLSKDSLIELELLLEPLPPPETYVTIPGIYYDLDKWDLRSESKQVLDSLIIILNNNPGIVIEIGSHTDSRAPADYNIELSKKRAKSCVDYLVAKGISKERLQAIGYGESKLTNDCSDGVDCSEEEHQQNRRTTFRILKTDFKRK